MSVQIADLYYTKLRWVVSVFFFQCITRADCSSVKLDTSSGTCQLIDSAIFACDDTAYGVYHKVTLSLCSTYYNHTFAYIYSICMRKRFMYAASV